MQRENYFYILHILANMILSVYLYANSFLCVLLQIYVCICRNNAFLECVYTFVRIVSVCRNVKIHITHEMRKSRLIVINVER